jgi:hypothetical protein
LTLIRRHHVQPPKILVQRFEKMLNAALQMPEAMRDEIQKTRGMT